MVAATGTIEIMSNATLTLDYSFLIGTEVTPVLNNDKGIRMVPVDWFYWAIHVISIVILFLSIICSVVVIIWQQKTASSKNLFKRKLGERLVVYLAITDFVISVCHFSDHVIIILWQGYKPPGIPCIVFASVLAETTFAQSLLVLVTALSLCLLVSCNRKISFGPFDIGLLFVSYVVPLILVIYLAAMDYLGYHGYWCFMNFVNPAALELLMIQGLIQTVVFLANCALYAIVWLTIMQSARRLNGFDKNSDKASTNQKSNTKTAKILTLFGGAYLLQWWPALIAGVWVFFGQIPTNYFFTYVIFHNSGGVCNMLAYTFVRKWDTGGNTKQPNSSIGSSSTVGSQHTIYSVSHPKSNNNERG